MLRAHIDEPIRATSVKGSSVLVRGWVWLDIEHPRLEAVEAWSQGRMLGETRSLQPRPDVTAALALPATALPGFSIAASMPPGTGAQLLTLSVCARFRNGERSGPLAEVEVIPHVRPAEPLAALADSVRPDDLGLALGSPRQALPGLLPFCAAFPGAPSGSLSPNFLAHPSALPLPDAVLDYLCAFQILERSSDPITTLLEWHRVLADDGWLYLAVKTSPRATRSPEEYRCVFLQGDVPSAWSAAGAPQPHGTQATSGGFSKESLLELLQTTGITGGRSPRFELREHTSSLPGDGGEFGLLMRKYRSGRRTVFPETFTLAHAQRKIAPLPLVCPATLKPLGATSRPDGSKGFQVIGGERFYPMPGPVPVLLPKPSEKLHRPWNHPLRRRLGWY